MRTASRRLLALTGILALTSLAFWHDAISQGMIFPKTQLTLFTGSGPHVLNVDVASNTSEADFGLKYRGTLAPDTGLLIILSSAAPEPISVKTEGVPMPLDLLFIASDGTVMEVHPAIPADSSTAITSNSPVAAALELNAGSIAEYGIVAGDKVTGGGLG